MMLHSKFPESYYTQIIKEILSLEDSMRDTGNPELVLYYALKMLSQNLHLNRGRIFLWDSLAQRLQIRFSYNLTKREIAKGKYEICEGITGEVFDTGKSALIPDINAVSNYKGKVTPRSITQVTPISYIAVPINYKKSRLGVLAVETIAHYDGDLEANAVVLNLVAEMLGKIIESFSLCDFDDAA